MHLFNVGRSWHMARAHTPQHRTSLRVHHTGAQRLGRNRKNCTHFSILRMFITKYRKGAATEGDGPMLSNWSTLDARASIVCMICSSSASDTWCPEARSFMYFSINGIGSIAGCEEVPVGSGCDGVRPAGASFGMDACFNRLGTLGFRGSTGMEDISRHDWRLSMLPSCCF